MSQILYLGSGFHFMKSKKRNIGKKRFPFVDIKFETISLHMNVFYSSANSHRCGLNIK